MYMCSIDLYYIIGNSSRCNVLSYFSIAHSWLLYLWVDINIAIPIYGHSICIIWDINVHEQTPDGISYELL